MAALRVFQVQAGTEAGLLITLPLIPSRQGRGEQLLSREGKRIVEQDGSTTQSSLVLFYFIR